jgi:hypothetical protein
MAYHRDDRLLLLLGHLSQTSYRPSPKGSGLKTAITAREMGLIEWQARTPNLEFRLTTAGLRYYRRAGRYLRLQSCDPR